MFLFVLWRFIFRDYFGARDAGLHTLLLRRPEESNETRLRDDAEPGADVQQIGGLGEVLDLVDGVELELEGASRTGSGSADVP